MIWLELFNYILIFMVGIFIFGILLVVGIQAFIVCAYHIKEWFEQYMP